MPAPDSLAAPTIAEAPFDSGNRLTQTSVQIPRVKRGVANGDPMTISSKDCCNEMVGGWGIKEEWKQKTWM